MAKDDWTYSDPLPELLALLKILRQCPDNSAEIAVHNARLKGIMKDAREGAAAIPGAELGLNDQVEVIKRLQARLDAQRYDTLSSQIAFQLLK